MNTILGTEVLDRGRRGIARALGAVATLPNTDPLFAAALHRIRLEVRAAASLAELAARWNVSERHARRLIALFFPSHARPFIERRRDREAA